MEGCGEVVVEKSKFLAEVWIGLFRACYLY